MLNKVILKGEVSKDSQYLFTTKSGREKYQFYVDCKRDSGTVDTIPVIAYAGDMKALKNAMKVHGDYEYAMLYKKTPEYHKNK